MHGSTLFLFHIKNVFFQRAWHFSLFRATTQLNYDHWKIKFVMDGPRDGHTKWSKQRSRNIAWCLLDAESKETWSKRAYETEMDSQRRKLWLPGERTGEGTVRECGMDRCTLLCLKCNPTRPTEEHRELCSMLCGSLMGGEPGGEGMHVYVWLRPFAAHLKLSQHC